MARRIIAVSADDIDTTEAGPVMALVQGTRETALAAIVGVMHRHERVVAAALAEAVGPAASDDLAARASGELAGVRMPASATTRRVGDREAKLVCLRSVRAACEAAGANAGQLDAVEQCVDELVENALFDAPVDAADRRVFADVPPRRRNTLRTEHDVEVVFGADGSRFVVAVRDAFGTLRRGALLRHLDKGLHASQHVERKIGGAGVGLFLVANAASAISITVAPGASTEIACAFEIGRISPAAWLDFVELAPAPVRTTARVVRTARARRRLLAIVAAASAVLVPATVLALSALPPATTTLVFATEPRDAIVELDGRRLPRGEAGAVAAAVVVGQPYRVHVHRDGYAPVAETLVPRVATEHAIRLDAVATLEVDSSPTGAEVRVDGNALGSTPLRITSLPPGTSVELAFAKPGYVDAATRVTVPQRGAAARHGQQLEPSPAVARVRLVTRPPGALVLREGTPRSADRTYTPADVIVPRDRPARFTLSMRGRVPVVLVVDGTTREIAAELAVGTAVRFTAAAGTISVVGAAHCTALAVPAECTLAPGRYEVTFAVPGGAAETRTIDVGSEPLTVER